MQILWNILLETEIVLNPISFSGLWNSYITAKAHQKQNLSSDPIQMKANRITKQNINGLGILKV